MIKNVGEEIGKDNLRILDNPEKLLQDQVPLKDDEEIDDAEKDTADKPSLLGN